MAKLTKEEKDLLSSYERSEWRSVKHVKSEMSRYQAMAKATLHKDKRINIRLSSQDLEGVQKKPLKMVSPIKHSSLASFTAMSPVGSRKR